VGGAQIVAGLREHGQRLVRERFGLGDRVVRLGREA
jgi:hypothetical protein